jgi:hypothetical protein
MHGVEIGEGAGVDFDFVQCAFFAPPPPSDDG